MKIGLSESEAEAEELNQSQSVRAYIVIGLFFPAAFASYPDNLVFTRRWNRKRSRKKMETFWFFWLRFLRAYDSAYYSSDFWFSPGHKRSILYDSAYDSASVAWVKTQPLCGAFFSRKKTIRQTNFEPDKAAVFHVVPGVVAAFREDIKIKTQRHEVSAVGKQTCCICFYTWIHLLNCNQCETRLVLERDQKRD